MRTEIKTKIAVVHSRDPDEFERLYNEKVDSIDRFKGRQMYVENGELIAVIDYEERTDHIESVKDEYHLEGIHFFCRNCPFKRKPNDRRQKHVDCKYAEYGHTHVDHEACEYFYRMVKQGEVRPLD